MPRVYVLINVGTCLTWLTIEAIVFRKATSLGSVSGILAGLVAITPAAGVVKPVGAIVLGAVSSILCYCALRARIDLATMIVWIASAFTELAADRVCCCFHSGSVIAGCKTQVMR